MMRSMRVKERATNPNRFPSVLVKVYVAVSHKHHFKLVAFRRLVVLWVCVDA